VSARTEDASREAGALPATTGEPDPAPQRVPAGRRSGRRPGDSGTRQLIAAAARRQFGEQGYDRTSIRSVAAEAGVDPALVMRFYGSKQQLFEAVLDLPFDPAGVLASVTAGDRAQAGERLARFLVTAMQTPESAAAVTGLVRAATSEPEAARVLRERYTRDVLLPLARRLDVDRPELRAALTATQTVGLVMSRHILQLEPLAGLADDEVVRLVAPTLQRYLTEPL
jgi:AcrR family transcriptional regulator